ncbi:MAG TPA: phosphate ABC transporter permease subunit PstC [Acidimicrobiales bacterium]|nr:phosphate ABC transporter permease subunit PstC [Acidimicrobiales bacterium]
MPNGLYRAMLAGAGLVFVALLVGFVVDLVVQARPAFAHFGVGFITGTQWNPVTGHYGALPFIVGTLETTLIAMVLAIPIGLGAALALSHLLPPRTRVVLGGAVELLAAIPSVVYGLWGLLVLAPFTRSVIEPAVAFVFGHAGPGSGAEIGIGLLLAGLILAIMVLPTMVAISRDVLAAVPADQVEGALALGATRGQVLWRVVVPHARAGLLGAVTLATGRALGETIAVTMVIGNTPAFAHSLFDTGATMSSIIANQFTEATEPFHLASLIAIAVLLLVVTALVNVAARLLVRSVGRSRAAIALA